VIGFRWADAGVHVTGDNGVRVVMRMPDVVQMGPVVGGCLIGGDAWGEGKVHVIFIEEIKEGLDCNI